MTDTKLIEDGLRVGWSERYLKDLSTVLQSEDITATSKYYVGIADVMARQAGLEPDRWILEQASRCEGFGNVEPLARHWINHTKRESGKRIVKTVGQTFERALIPKTREQRKRRRR